MNNTVLENNYRTLSTYKLLKTDEKKEFTIFIKSQTEQGIYWRLALYLSHTESITETKLQQKVFLKPFTNVYLRKVLSEFGKFVQEFLIFKELNVLGSIKNSLLQQAYNRRGSTVKTPSPTSNDRFSLLTNYLGQSEDFNTALQNNRASELPYNRLLNSLSIYYCYEMLKCLILQASQKQVYNTEIDTFYIQNYQQLLDKLDEKPLIIDLLVLTLKLQQEADPATYFTLKSKLLANNKTLVNEDVKNSIMVLLNFCIKQINKGDKTFDTEAFEWYKLGLDEGYLITNNSITSVTYRNAVASAIKVKEFDWATQTVERLKHCLPSEYQTSNYSYCMAWLLFEQQQYKKTLKYLQDIEYNDELLALNSKTILLKVFYELNDHQSLESLLDSFSSYIKRKKIKGFYKTYFLSLIKYTKTLLKSYTTFQLEKLKKEIETAPSVASRDWLLAKVSLQI